jgi:hypothetical protein
MMSPIVLAALALIGTFLYRRLRYKRFDQHAGFPQMPVHLLLGHLMTIDNFMKDVPSDGHPGASPASARVLLPLDLLT